ncbi:DUF4180 domain-containing protein [Bacteroidota bacterium]
MNIEILINKDKKIAELTNTNRVINELQDALDLLGNSSYNEAMGIIVYAHQLHPDFYILSTGLAGEILQKFSNYRMKLAIVGDFRQYTSKSLHDFIFESNANGSINFVGSREEAIDVLSG